MAEKTSDLHFDRKTHTQMKTTSARIVRPTALVLASALVTAAFAAVPVAAQAAPDPATYTVTTSAASVLPGDTVTVTVSGAQVAQLYSYDLDVDFDTSKFAYVEDSAATDLTGATYDSVEASTVSVVHTKLGTSPAADGDVTLATLEFTALRSGDGVFSASSLDFVDSANNRGSASELGTSTVSIVKHEAPIATKTPAISGTKNVGYTLSVTPGTWDVSDLVYSYSWLRDGRPISGAKSSTYKVKPIDAGKKLSVKVSVEKDDYLPATVTTAATTMSKAVTSISIAATPQSKKSKKVTVTVTVKATGITPEGYVKVRFGGKTVKSKATLKNGKVTVTFTPKVTGTRTLTTVFVPKTGFRSAVKSTKIKVS